MTRSVSGGNNSADRGYSHLQQHARPPPLLSLQDNMGESWKRFKTRWANYSLLSGLHDMPREIQVAQLENCLADDALKTLEGFDFPTGEDERTVQEMMMAFERYAIGEIHETLERYKFGKRQQQEGESMDKFLADLRILMKTCQYCPRCEPSILRDRIILGIRSNDIREELLKVRHLALDKCIDICKASETAASHSDALVPDNVNRVLDGKQRDDTKECKFCSFNHPMKKEKCPAWGKVCNKCGKMNHFESKCHETSNKSARFGRHPSQGRKQHKRYADKGRVNQVDESSSSDDGNREWCNCISTPTKKSVKCKMLVAGQEVTFLIDTGASINMLPVKYAKYGTEPYSGVLKMWNEAEDKPTGTCRMKVTNPRNDKKYSVPFVVFEGDRLPILSYRTSLQMKLITVEKGNFDMVAGVATESYPDVFDGELGELPGIQHLKLKPESQPSVMANRRVPLALRPRLKSELDKLTQLGVITPVEEATPWVSQIVVTHKKSGDLRVCLDPHELNKCILREHFTLPILEDVLHELRDAKVFSKADLASGYWHVKLDEESSLLTTFQTCFGRYRYLRLPFGINGSSEYFQKKLVDALQGLPGVVCIADDVVIHGRDTEEHDRHLNLFLLRCREKGIKLNRAKLETKVESLTFMGHRISKDGLSIDPSKVSSMRGMEEPCSLETLRRFLGMVNYLAKFLPNITELMNPLLNLLKKDVPWNWSSSQQKSFDSVKEAITTAPVLAYYDPGKPLTLENDACEYGIGSALLQGGKPIAFASRSLSDSERRYAQIEKEMLAVTYGLEKFHHYTFGRQVFVVTDHKPLVSISNKPLSKAPKRLQNLLMRAQRYTFELRWSPGTEIPVADVLSRAPLQKPSEEELIHCVTENGLRDERLQQIRDATATDQSLTILGEIILKGWPNQKDGVPMEALPYFNYRDELTIQDGIVYRGDRIVVPKALRPDMKNRVHAGHLGINSCLRRARDLIYWPGMSAEIRQHVETCGTCATYASKQPQETSVITGIPDRPWKKVATDMLNWAGDEYLVTVDYHSGFFELDKLNDITSTAIIEKLKAHFARHGAPDTLVSDNATQYVSAPFKAFTRNWGFTHETISPGNSQANGAAEAAVKIAKRILRKSQSSGEDPYIALLNLRNTPTEGLNTSPTQRLFGMRTKSMMPTAEAKLRPGYIDPSREAELKVNRRALTAPSGRRDLKRLHVGDTVRMQPIRTGEREWRQARVKRAITTRAFEVEADGRCYRRNRRHLRISAKSTHSLPAKQYSASAARRDANEPAPPIEPPEVPTLEGAALQSEEIDRDTTGEASLTTRCGRQIRKPKRFEV